MRPHAFAPLPCVRVLTLALALGSSSAPAQELGLDLSADAPPPAADLRPQLAIIGVGFAEGVTPDKPNQFLATKLETTLVAQARAADLFRNVLEPAEVEHRLAADYGDATRCAEAACLQSLAQKLGVPRLIVLQQSITDGEAALKVTAFSEGTEPNSIDLSSNGPVRAEFVNRVGTIVQALITNLGTPLAHLKVTTNVPASSVQFDERPVGTGQLDKDVASGDHTVRVTAPGYYTYEKEISLDPGGSAELSAQLTARPVEQDTRKVARSVTTRAPPPAVPLLKNPGTYIALAGVAVLAAGAVVGAQVAGISGRSIDANGDGVLDVTRADALAARQNAPLATALLAVGGGLVAAGGITFFVAPSLMAPPAHATMAEPTASRGPDLGAHLILAGAFR